LKGRKKKNFDQPALAGKTEETKGNVNPNKKKKGGGLTDSFLIAKENRKRDPRRFGEKKKGG